MDIADMAHEMDSLPECSCGVFWECGKRTHCSSHGQDSIHIELNPEELGKFISTLKPIYEILLYLRGNLQYAKLAREVEDQLISTLAGLNENCLEYIRMTTQLFLQKCDGKTIF